MRKNVIIIPPETTSAAVATSVVASPSSSFSKASSCCSIHSASQSSGIRVIRLRKSGSVPFGFSIRGGREHGTGVFVSEVHPGSEADVQGLVAGDEIIKVNDFASDQASHEEVSRIIKSSHKISLKVKTSASSTLPSSGSLSRVDAAETGSNNNNNNSMRDPRWTVVPMIVTSGTSSSASHAKHHHHNHHHHVQHRQLTFNPVTQTASQSRRKCPIHHNTHAPHQGSGSKFHSTSSRGSSSSPSDSDQDHDLTISHGHNPFTDADNEIVEEKVYITLKSGQSLGCSVVRGPTAYPGIFVQDVRMNSPSCNAGLEIGDQILAMNGFSFYPGHYNFDDAINKIKACTQMTLTVRKRVGLHLFHDIKRKNNVHKIRAVVHSPQENDSDYDPEKDFDLTGICGVHGGSGAGNGSHGQTEVKMLTDRSVNGSYAEEILQKVRVEEERLAEDRRILAAEQHKLQQEMRRLALERKELEAMRLQGKSEDGGSSISSGDVSMLSSSSPDPLASCSVSSTSCNSSTTSSSCETTTGNTFTSSGSPALGFLDELKQLAEKRSSSDCSLLLDTLKKTVIADASHAAISSGGKEPALVTGPGVSGRMRVVKQLVHPDDEKRKRHELLMEEFKSAHLKMFGKASNLLTQDEASTPSLMNPAKVSQVGESNDDKGDALPTNPLIKTLRSSSSRIVEDESKSRNVCRLIEPVNDVASSSAVHAAASSSISTTNTTVAAGKALFSKRNVTSSVQGTVKGSSSSSSSSSVAALSDKTISTPVTRSPANVTSGVPENKATPAPAAPTPLLLHTTEKVMILKTLNCNNNSRKNHPPPPPPPLPGTILVTRKLTGTTIPAAPNNPMQAAAAAPLVTITSYQTKSRSSKDNRFLAERESNPSHHVLPVKINLIRSSRDDK